MALLDCEG